LEQVGCGPDGLQSWTILSPKKLGLRGRTEARGERPIYLRPYLSDFNPMARASLLDIKQLLGLAKARL